MLEVCSTEKHRKWPRPLCHVSLHSHIRRILLQPFYTGYLGKLKFLTLFAKFQYIGSFKQFRENYKLRFEDTGSAPTR